MKKKRLDRVLVEKKITSSRERAKDLIFKEGIKVNGEIIKKPSALVDDFSKIEVLKDDIFWVSRAGIKLDYAFNEWKISSKNKICLDIGASTGGFVDVLLYYGAEKVYALDVGHFQLSEKVKKNPKVINLEGLNIKDLKDSNIKENLDLVTIDVSFISLNLVLPVVVDFLNKKSDIVALIKPQFELGEGVVKKGIVKNSEKHKEAIDNIKNKAEALNLKVYSVIESPILGRRGNKEFLIYLK